MINNETKYETLLMGLHISKDVLIKKLKIYGDSQLIVNKVKRTYEVYDPIITLYIIEIRTILVDILSFNIEHIP